MSDEVEDSTLEDLSDDTSEDTSTEETDTGSEETENTDTSDSEEEETEDETTDEDEEKIDKPEDDGKKTESKDKQGGDLTKPVFKEVKAKYPDLFKDFPQLRHAFFREQEFSKVFSTVDDAKEAVEDANTFKLIDKDLSEGKIDNLLAALGKNNYQAFSKVANTFLPTLYELDKDTFYAVTEPVLDNALRAAFKEGKGSGDKNLQLAAQHLRKFYFKDHNFSDVPKQERIDPEKEQLIKERDGLRSSTIDNYVNDVNTSIVSTFEAEVSKGLSLEGVSEFVKKKAVQEIMAQVGEKLQSDQAHGRAMTSLWDKARRTLDPNLKGRLLNTALTRAREYLPSVMATVKADVMGTQKSTKKTTTEPKRIAGGGTPNSKGNVVNPKTVDWNKTTDLDVLNGKITYKK